MYNVQFIKHFAYVNGPLIKSQILPKEYRQISKHALPMDQLPAISKLNNISEQWVHMTVLIVDSVEGYYKRYHTKTVNRLNPAWTTIIQPTAIKKCKKSKVD